MTYEKMTPKQAIEVLKKDKRLIHERGIIRIIEFLEELNNKTEECKLLTKALEIACKDNGWSNCDYYLEKARAEI